MKRIDFPQPVHEQAEAVLEKAKKELEALGFHAGFAGSVECQNVRQSAVNYETATACETAAAAARPVFKLSFTAAIEV
jgi:hypothetical protein